MLDNFLADKDAQADRDVVIQMCAENTMWTMKSYGKLEQQSERDRWNFWDIMKEDGMNNLTLIKHEVKKSSGKQ